MSIRKCPSCEWVDTNELRCNHCGHVYIRKPHVILSAISFALMVASIFSLTKDPPSDTAKIVGYGLAICSTLSLSPIILWVAFLFRSTSAMGSVQTQQTNKHPSGPLSSYPTIKKQSTSTTSQRQAALQNYYSAELEKMVADLKVIPCLPETDHRNVTKDSYYSTARDTTVALLCEVPLQTRFHLSLDDNILSASLEEEKCSTIYKCFRLDETRWVIRSEFYWTDW